MSYFVRSVLTAIIVIGFTAACGQKGPLYHPHEKPAAKKPAKSPPASEADAPRPAH